MNRLQVNRDCPSLQDSSMADVENQPDSSFPVKRKSDLFSQDQNNVANKAQKLNPTSADSESKEGDTNGSDIENLNSFTEEKIGAETSISPEKAVGSESERDENGVAGDLGYEQGKEGGNIDEEEEEDEEEEDEEEENYSIEPETDRKGKGISREEKGKGKLIEVDESDDEDDSDDDEEGGDEESDFSDDPLAEVDMDNILPSRTRRRSIQPAVYMSNEISNRGGTNDEDDDSSDDSDA